MLCTSPFFLVSAKRLLNVPFAPQTHKPPLPTSPLNQPQRFCGPKPNKHQCHEPLYSGGLRIYQHSRAEFSVGLVVIIVVLLSAKGVGQLASVLGCELGQLGQGGGPGGNLSVLLKLPRITGLFGVGLLQLWSCQEQDSGRR